MNAVDPILFVLLSLFALRGYFKGFFRESFSLLGLLIGFMVAVRYDEVVAALWANTWQLPLIVLKAAAFIGLFFAVYITFSLAGRVVHHYIKFLLLKATDRIGGILLGVGKGLAVLSLIVFFLGTSSLVPQRVRQTFDGSHLAPPLYRFAQGLIWIGKSNLLPQDNSQAGEEEKDEFF